MFQNKWNGVIVGVVAVVALCVAFAIGQRTSCWDFFGMAKGCIIDTTRH